MVDKFGTEDSYSYPQEDASDEYSQSSVSGSTEGLKTVLRNRRLWVTMGAIVAMWVVVWLIGMIYKDVDASSVPAKPVKVEQPAPPIVETVPQPRVKAPDDLARVSSVEKMLENNQAQIQALNNDKTRLEAQLAELTHEMHNTHYQINLLMDKVSEITVKLTAMKKPKPKPQPKPIVVQAPKKVYTLRAIITGRAWIDQGNDESISVTLGDSLESYGKVKGIFPDDGIVTTTSGRTIQFGKNG